MESLLKKSWKKVFIVFGAIVLAFGLYFKIIWKPTVVNDYVNSDINIRKDVIDQIKDKSSDIAEDAKEADLSTRNEDGSRSVIGWTIVFAAVVVGILVLDLIMQPGESKKK